MLRKIVYQKVQILVPDYLLQLWPHDLPLDGWPSYCGAGDGWGDKLIPEVICGVPSSCICFIHDNMWAVAEDTFIAAMKSNWTMYKNLNAFVLANYDQTKYQRSEVEAVCMIYLIGTIIGIRRNFSPDGTADDPFSSPTVRSRLKRLATVCDIDPKFYEVPSA